MRGIVKMVRDTLTAAFYETQQKHAHPTFVTLQMLVLKYPFSLGTALKIRVSAVRFCPRPPDTPHSFERSCGVFLWAQRKTRKAYAAPTCYTL
jgi:hypothetical protein